MATVPPARRGRPWRPGYPAVKRGVDVLVSATGLVLASPVMAAVAAAVRWKLGSPVFFRQQRPGLDGRPFELLKFRTMRVLGPSDGVANDADRLTPFGLWLRSTSLDELPSLWNVVRGDMSLVGPRPLLMEYLDRYSPEQRRRHEVRPGITGLAQVRGRNLLGWEEKFSADVEYVDGLGPRMDLRILLATLVKVLQRHGVSAPGEANMLPFMGSGHVTGVTDGNDLRERAVERR
ncbi:sugar transferase [Blastococcus sp. URHD0036]|uniref:sugar transferase n=1 Tax=Blastococcus sp. URHD0036 TaxID=1380356 RepID=UPI00068EC25F|nr:sugar transferase [Blastococcus sp. URHD0036]